MGILIGILRSTTLWVLVYVLIGIGVNTNPPHYPSFPPGFNAGLELHSLAQYLISVLLWPLSLWSPSFTVGKWTGL